MAEFDDQLNISLSWPADEFGDHPPANRREQTSDGRRADKVGGVGPDPPERSPRPNDEQARLLQELSERISVLESVQAQLVDSVTKLAGALEDRSPGPEQTPGPSERTPRPSAAARGAAKRTKIERVPHPST